MYMPGRLRTASRPSSTWMLAASYVLPAATGESVALAPRAGGREIRGGAAGGVVPPVLVTPPSLPVIPDFSDIDSAPVAAAPQTHGHTFRTDTHGPRSGKTTG